jgi:hypothetical protein
VADEAALLRQQATGVTEATWRATWNAGLA